MPSYHFDDDRPVDLTVRIVAGEVRLATGPGPIDVQVECPDDPGYAERVVVTHSDRRPRPALVIAAPREGGLFGRMTEHRAHLIVTVRLPDGSALDATTASAAVTAEGSWSVARVTTASGEARIETVDGDVSIRTASGDMTLGSAGGRVTAKTASGDVYLREVRAGAQVDSASGDVLVGDAGAELTLRSASGDMLVRSCRGVRARTATGDVQIDSASSGRVSVQTTSGDVSVAVPAGTLVRVDAQTVSGSLESEIELDAEPPPADRTTGESSSMVHVDAHTVSGDIRIGRAVAAAAPRGA